LCRCHKTSFAFEPLYLQGIAACRAKPLHLEARESRVLVRGVFWLQPTIPSPESS
jgi:hypothetical protein